MEVSHFAICDIAYDPDGYKRSIWGRRYSEGGLILENAISHIIQMEVTLLWYKMMLLWYCHTMKCDIAYDPQVPAEIRHEGGETLRTSFSRDLAKCVNNVAIVLKLSKLNLRIRNPNIINALWSYIMPIYASGYWWLSWTSTTAPKARRLKGEALSSHRPVYSILVFNCNCTTRAFWWSSIKYKMFWSIKVFWSLYYF